MSHVNKVIDADPHFVIDINTRNIKNVSQTKTSLVQYDHNSERFSFTLPRFIEGHDMLECNSVQVHYFSSANPDTKGVYAVTDLAECAEDAEQVCCTWLISQNVTQTAGALQFMLRFACVAEDGTVEYAWHTNPFRGISVAAGMNNAEAIIEQYADILEQWYAQLFSTSEEGIRNINTAKADAMNAINAATYNIANALKGTASGQSVVLDDISPVEHPVQVKVKRKNIIPYPFDTTTTTITGVTFTNNGDGTITVNGTNTGASEVSFAVHKASTGRLVFEKGKIYTISGIPLGASKNSYYAIFQTGSGQQSTLLTGNFTTEIWYDVGYMLQIRVASGATVDNVTFKLQAEEGTEATEYTPYMADVSGVWVEVTDDSGRYEETLPTDGTVEVNSSYPSMSIRAMNTGAVLDVSYNRDINKAFSELEEKLTSAIISLGGNV